MKLKDYIQKLNTLIVSHPDALEYEVVTSKDDEGNAFNPVLYDPSIGVYIDRDFIASDTLGDCGMNIDDINAVCLN
jgi:hypothetical protein